MRIVSRLKRHNKDIFIFLGGYLPTLSYTMVLNKIKEVDCCVLGEGEYVCLELIKALEYGNNWKEVKNIAYRENDIVHISSLAEPIKELDALPFPKRVVLNKMFVPISTSRGVMENVIFVAFGNFMINVPLSQCDFAVRRMSFKKLNKYKKI